MAGYAKMTDAERQELKDDLLMADLCRVSGCEKKPHGHGLCSIHYMRWRRHGSPTAGSTPRGAAAAFIIRAIRHVGDDCLLWPYAKSSYGYGHATKNLRHVDSHVQVCEAAHGARPSVGHEVAHSCGVRLCCNPAHLRWATRRDNRADSLLHGTRRRGEQHGQAKLTTEQVLEIRARPDDAPRDLATEFNVNVTTINMIRWRATWRHLP